MSQNKQLAPSEPVIIDAVRSPFGRRGGALRETRPDAMLATVLQALLARSGVPADRVGDVLTGCVSQAGEQGGNIGRQALLLRSEERRVGTESTSAGSRACGTQ